MNYLIIDTSKQSLYIGAYIDNKEYYFYDENLNKKHSQTLLYHLDKLIAQNNIKLKDFDCFCCATGPGSFTGIRIGITTVRAFAQVFEKPVMAVNSLELKAYNIKVNGALLPLIEAVKDKYYLAAYYEGKQILPPRMCDINKLIEIKNDLARKYGKAYIVSEYNLETGDTIKPAFEDYFGFCNEKISLGEFTHYKNLLPVYAAVSQAERDYGYNIAELDKK